MAEDRVYQDSDKMAKLADEIDSDSKELGKLVDEMYSLLSTKIGASEDREKVWFGPKAELFLQNINNKKDDFEAQINNIERISRNLAEQAQAWANFEAK